MKIALLIFSSNRLEFLNSTLKSLHQQVDFGNHQVYKILIDDYPQNRNDDEFLKIQKKYNIDRLILHSENQGYSVSWKEGWDNIPEDTDFVFHQEDDFTYNTQVDISKILDLFENSQHVLAQICLKRQVWYHPSMDFIHGIDSGRINSTTEKIGNEMLVLHQHLFNPNPCIYPHWVVKLCDNLPTVQENVIMEQIINTSTSIFCAMYGNNPIVHHVGVYTQGKRMLPGEPGSENYVEYDPKLKYDAKLPLTLYTPDVFQLTNELPNTIIVDNFYQDPDAVRDFALQQDFCISGNYPGKRTKSFGTLKLKERFEKLIGKKIVHWPGYYNGSFQYCQQGMKSWIHRDGTQYSAIIYLSPDPPLQSGTSIYRHISSGLSRCSIQEEDMLRDCASNYEEWEKINTYGNLYNRCVIFCGKYSHQSDEYFGNSLENSRLFQIFFFDT